MRNIDYFDKSATLYPERTVLVADGRDISYAEMQELTHRVAGAMLDAGLAHQEAVAIMSPNHPAVLTAMLGLWRAGAAWIPVNTRNALSDNVAYLNYVRAAWLFYHSSYSADAHEVARQVPSIRHLVCLDAEDAGHPSLDTFMRPAGSPPVADWGEPMGNGDELTAIIATGGTTGPAKGVRVLNR
ncbi:MAG: AMP-binding protein, partial [Novosphingobium sp.]